MRVLSHVETFISKRHPVRSCKYCALTPKDIFPTSFLLADRLEALQITRWIANKIHFDQEASEEYQGFSGLSPISLVSEDLHQQTIPSHTILN